ncbi:MAG: PfkB family carbohydrate kinase [Clostridiaceae bacterium]|nr:PfkB family carbohydrate kinase [Eubacteriales bacterium]
MKYKVTVVGGITTDITGFPSRALLLRDSNPGRVKISEGGVGRNIAENLVRMGFETELICAMGCDAYADAHLSHAEALGLSLKNAVRVEGGRSGVYLCLCDESGDMFAALNDMDDIFAALAPERVNMEAVNAGDLCVIDANLPEETLAFIAKNARVPVVADPVSAAKAARLIEALPYLSVIKPNLLEARALTGKSTPDEAADALLDAGVKRVFLSLGTQGVFYADANARGTARVETVKAVNATGAGDAATAAICAGYLMQLSMEECARLAARLGALTVQSESAVSPSLTREFLTLL